jgi:hypothetical protein
MNILGLRKLGMKYGMMMSVRGSGRNQLYPCICTEGRRYQQKPIWTASVQYEIRTGTELNIYFNKVSTRD